MPVNIIFLLIFLNKLVSYPTKTTYVLYIISYMCTYCTVYSTLIFRDVGNFFFLTETEVLFLGADKIPNL